MKELIKIESGLIGLEEVNTVNSRELHKVLEIKKDYSDWIKAQINSLGLEENIDYTLFPQKGENPNLWGGRPSKDYIISLDCAKHIAMASRTIKGKEVRKYFIEVEKNFHIGKEQFDSALKALSDKSSLAQNYKEAYYEQLEIVNSLLVEKVKNMEEIINTPSKKRVPFDESEVKTIIKMKKQGCSYTQIAKSLGRTQGAISVKVAEIRRCGQIEI